jgi:hypothetical protein
MKFEDRLQTMFQSADAGMPAGPEVSWIDTIHKARRDRKLYVVAVATALGAVVGATALAASTLIGRETPAPSPPTQTPAPPENSLDDAEPVLRTWLQAISDSDEEKVWNLMTSEAQAIIGRRRFDEMMASALPEGLGAFASASGFSYVVVPTGGEERRVVAVVSGEVTREGNTERAAVAIPMRVVGDRVLVDDPFVGRDAYYDRVAIFASVSSGPFSFHSGDELIVEYTDPEGIKEAWIAIDADKRPLATDFDRARGRVSATLDQDLERGPHIATVIVLNESGRLYPEAIPFEAAAP